MTHVCAGCSPGESHHCAGDGVADELPDRARQPAPGASAGSAAVAGASAFVGSVGADRAGGALDDITTLTTSRVPAFADTALAANPLFQHRLGQADTRLRAARTLLYHDAGEGDRPLAANTTRSLRLPWYTVHGQNHGPVDRARPSPGVSGGTIPSG